MNSRVQWAATYLAQARCVSRPQRGAISITPRGTSLLATHPKRIDYTLLRQYPEFVAFMDGSKGLTKVVASPNVPVEAEAAPDELIDHGIPSPPRRGRVDPP